MNYIRHLTGFFDKIQNDEQLNPTHISLYLALFQFWNLNLFRNPISISRNEMMKLSKISAYGTYHKCIKELHQFGYIEYLPSFNPYKGSLVHLFDFGDLDKINSEENFIQNISTLCEFLIREVFLQWQRIQFLKLKKLLTDLRWKLQARLVFFCIKIF